MMESMLNKLNVWLSKFQLNTQLKMSTYFLSIILGFICFMNLIIQNRCSGRAGRFYRIFRLRISKRSRKDGNPGHVEGMYTKRMSGANSRLPQGGFVVKCGVEETSLGYNQQRRKRKSSLAIFRKTALSFALRVILPK